MNIEFLLHEKDLWKNIWAKLLPWEIEFEKMVFEGRIYEHRMFMKKNKLACWTIFLHIVDFLLHYVACVKSVKKKLGTTYVQHLKNHMLTIDGNYVKNSTILKMEETLMEESTSV